MANPFTSAMLAERRSLMESVRTKFVKMFNQTVTKMVKDHPFQKDQCIALEIARRAAREMGVKEDSVEMVKLHNSWKSAIFTHKITTPMPTPAIKGMPRGPPVTTSTLFKVIAESAKLRFTYVTLDENGKPTGPEVFLSLHQRPIPNISSSSSSSPN